MSATFAKFHPNLILGGTYSGQIVLWDNRVQKRTPIQRTPLSASAHTVSKQNLAVLEDINKVFIYNFSIQCIACMWLVHKTHTI